MSTKPYQPRRGSVPAQAIDQITQQARPLSTAELAELLGQPQDALAPLLNGAHGLRLPAGFVPLKLSSRKGGDITEFPKDLQVREFPEVAA